jgi:hypothetical protein
MTVSLRSRTPPLATLAVGGALAVFALAGGCGGGDQTTGDASGSSPNDRTAETTRPTGERDSVVVIGTGTVQHVSLEGGFYGLVDGETGERYQPDTLGPAYRADGLEVRYRLLVRRDRVSFRMWGTPVDVLRIERLE